MGSMQVGKTRQDKARQGKQVGVGEHRKGCSALDVFTYFDA